VKENNSEEITPSPVLRLLGYQYRDTLRLRYPGQLSAAKATLESGDKQSDGRGLESGRFVISFEKNRLRLALFTPHGGSWYGPIFEGGLYPGENGYSELCGRFRLTYTQMFVAAFVQIAITIWGLQFVVAGVYKEYGVSTYVGVLLFVVVAFGAILLPHLFWKTRKWKMDAILKYLKDSDLTESVSEKGI